MNERKKLTIDVIINLFKEKGLVSPYEAYKEILKYKDIKYQVVCRYFYLLERCGIIRLVKVKPEGTKFPKHYYTLVPLEKYEVPDEIKRDPYFSGLSKHEIYSILISNPQMIFESYRRRHEYQSSKEAVKRYLKRKRHTD